MSIWASVEQMYGIKIKQTTKVRDVYKVRTAKTVYCLKGYDFPEEEVRFITQVLSFLRKQGHMRGQKVYPTTKNTPYIHYNGSYYTLTNWVNGRKPDFDRRHEFNSTLRTLAIFHEAAQGFPHTEAPPSRVRYSNLSHDIGRYKEALSDHAETKPLVQLCDEALDAMKQPKLTAAVEAEQRASAIVHGDYNYSNLVKDDCGKIHLIDFENTSLNLRMTDLSHVLHRNFAWNGSAVLRGIECYEKKRQLGASDLHLLHALLISPYPVVRSLRAKGLAQTKRLIPTAAQLKKYTRELKALL
ncbi:phosphotransferase [Paenibacillus xerothermodurans]|uniref:Sporulation protein n=1 Tax=Paenibacillus xerothermodurans TaxID=1977292 RepID=A0A2W1NAH8_PAEXE|nr:phosphotransferase [Paenibacillus xerothermodurans]PZE20191.1 sporulation protein [Paenibacillus xerothermodurans]